MLIMTKANGCKVVVDVEPLDLANRQIRAADYCAGRARRDRARVRRFARDRMFTRMIWFVGGWYLGASAAGWLA